MKKISKNKLDSLIHLSRLYWQTGDRLLLEPRIALGKEIEGESDVDWCAMNGFVDGIVKYKGLAPDADNETIYAALKLFGWEVAEDVEVDIAD